jgi:hypothetical protein
VIEMTKPANRYVRKCVVQQQDIIPFDYALL